MAYEIAELGTLLSSNAYPGRGIVIGRSGDGRQMAVVYFIMGRSRNSRNRVFVEEGDGLRIYPADESLGGDPRLVIYAPIRRLGDYLIVSNGDQTDTLYESMEKGMGFAETLMGRRFEPDAHWTPRISGLLHLSEGCQYRLSILKAQDREGQKCERAFYAYHAEPGLGHFLHTYQGDGEPLPSFTGEPRRVRIPDSAEEMAQEIWDNLQADNKISLYVRYIHRETGEATSILRNRYQRQ